MRMYIEVDIEEGTESVVAALDTLARAIVRQDADGDDEALSRKAAHIYRDAHPALLDIDVR